MDYFCEECPDKKDCNILNFTSPKCDKHWSYIFWNEKKLESEGK